MTQVQALVSRLREASKGQGEGVEAALRAIENDPPCLIPWTHLLVDASGEVMVCCLSSATVGNVNAKPLDMIWNGERAQRLRENFLKHNYDGCSLRCSFISERQARGAKIGEAEAPTTAIAGGGRNALPDIVRREDFD